MALSSSLSDRSVRPNRPPNTEPVPDEPGFYDNPSIYDILHTPGTAEEVTGLERTAGRFVHTRSRRLTWLEPACGSGRYLRVAARRGHHVIGFDLSQRMIDYARAHAKPRNPGVRARYVVADMESFIGKHCPPAAVDFAFNPINSIRHLTTDAAMLRHLDQVAEALKPGGVYAAGLGTTVYGLEPPSEDHWSGTRGRCRVDQHVQYDPPTGKEGGSRRERVTSHLVITTPRGERHATSRYALRTYSLEQWHNLVDRSPLRIDSVVDQDGRDADATPMGYRVYILRPREGPSGRRRRDP